MFANFEMFVDINNIWCKMSPCEFKGVFMFKEFIDYEMRPIFCPSREICKEFADIDILCGTLIEKNMFYLCKDLDKMYFDIWNLQRNVSVFAAYLSGKIIGFTSGFYNGRNMFTNALYVVPEYHGYGIGTSLLNTAENAATLVAKNMELISSDDAVSFYQERGYKNVVVQERIVKIKKLSKTIPGVVPVFDWNDKLSAKINVKFDTDLLNKCKHQPIFVYVNSEQKIDGIATRLSNGKDVISCKSGKDKSFIDAALSDALGNIR